MGVCYTLYMVAAYTRAFRLSFERQLTRRAAFLFMRVREFVLFAAILTLYRYTSLSQSVGGVDVSLYAVIGAIMQTQMEGDTAPYMSRDILEGRITGHLLRPYSYLAFMTTGSFANRSIRFAAGLVIALILSMIFSVPVFSALSWRAVVAAIPAFAMAIIILHLIDVINGLFAFWSDRVFGVSFLSLILASYLSGIYLPLAAFPMWAQRLVFVTPFPWIGHGPLSVILGASPWSVYGAQLAWTAGLSIITWVLWKRGVRRYSGYGG